ncbi:M6 family metalloprotease domain protein [Bacteroidales bacterium KA00344]|nr:M6 family metalloprotease domain protein [Bacteroidales bacterium KA00344]
MKKILLTLGFALLSVCSMQAHKAWPYPMTFVQSNGDTIVVRMHGDDYFSWYTDMEGNILERHGNNFKKIDVDEETFFAQAQQTLNAKGMYREPIAPAASLFPHMGSPKAVVILAQYPDMKFSLPNPRKSFDQYLNRTNGRPDNLGNGEHLNYGSVKQYFMTQSDGKFSPQFDIYGPVTLPQKMVYYGGTADDSKDEKHLQLLIDACTAMDDSLDFKPYDQDGDGKIDLVYIIYAGYGQSFGGAPETMWPKRFPVSTNTKFDGKGINQGGISNELIGNEGFPAEKNINGIGLFCHEFSHCLGLPDFYPTRLSTAHDNLGMEDWDLMDNGEYVENGYYPVSYTAWEREAMGWDHIPAITEAKQYKLDGNVSGGTNAVKIVNPNNSNEYFVLQHFEDKGWNQRIATYKNKKKKIKYNPKTRGLLIYHVDYNKRLFSLNSNDVNNNVNHPRMTVIPADGRLVSSYNTSLTPKDGKVTPYEYRQQLNGDIFRADDTYKDSVFVQSNGLPNAAWWNTADDTPVYNINYKDGAVYFDFLKHIATTGIRQLPTIEGNERIYTIDGRFVGTSAASLPRGIYIRGGKKFIK